MKVCPSPRVFFILGFRMTRSVQIHSVQDGKSREIAYDPAMFDYGKARVAPKEVPRDLGLRGSTCFSTPTGPGTASRFRGRPIFEPWMRPSSTECHSAGSPSTAACHIRKSFRTSVAFYLERPVAGSDTVTVHALLDSPSVSGAYRFVIKVADTTVMDVDAALYPRKQIERVGIAPGTSMFFYGKNDPRAGDDWRPEIHDSDGLQMYSGSGEWLWRPLINPRGVRVNSFADDQPRGFGLMQRERDFKQYQDDGVFYDKRPSVWVEPQGNWGKGSVMLVKSRRATRSRTTSSPSGLPSTSRSRGRSICSAIACTGGRGIPSSNRDRPLPRARGSAGSSGRSASISRGGSWWTSLAVRSSRSVTKRT